MRHDNLLKSLVKNPPFCSFRLINSPPFIPLFFTPLEQVQAGAPSPREGETDCPAMSYPLSIIERGTRGELKKFEE
jgi:hypothetical protein